MMLLLESKPIESLHLYLGDSLQLGADLVQFLFAVLQPGLEPLVLMQGFCIHLKMNKDLFRFDLYFYILVFLLF